MKRTKTVATGEIYIYISVTFIFVMILYVVIQQGTQLSLYDYSKEMFYGKGTEDYSRHLLGCFLLDPRGVLSPESLHNRSTSERGVHA